MSHAPISSGLGRGVQNAILSRGAHLSEGTNWSESSPVVEDRGLKLAVCGFVQNTRVIRVVGYFFSHVLRFATGSVGIRPLEGRLRRRSAESCARYSCEKPVPADVTHLPSVFSPCFIIVY
jgi:hypothetical protein